MALHHANVFVFFLHDFFFFNLPTRIVADDWFCRLSTTMREEMRTGPCINTQTNKYTLWCYKVKRPVFIAASVSPLQRATQTRRNLWRPNLNLPRILFTQTTLHPPHPPCTHTHSTAVLYFLWKQVAVRQTWKVCVCDCARVSISIWRYSA